MIGFKPMNNGFNGFADHSVNHFATPPNKACKGGFEPPIT